ncbi:uncharacterized protein BXZ73DRAFT_78052 [Epithele typhae]|uniref:uncharacterized protein n=1 Tax=Epithele typhae TaxID=378194 RepID=UPI00200720C2|nr:uncharacterized protein BXZ73DRAFT_78052 [Epithele typhae]KAH9929947.1 hypothetical protein BXZ73DRAFT_78052 [Epithele typhae]
MSYLPYRPPHTRGDGQPTAMLYDEDYTTVPPVPANPTTTPPPLSRGPSPLEHIAPQLVITASSGPYWDMCSLAPSRAQTDPGALGSTNIFERTLSTYETHLRVQLTIREHELRSNEHELNKLCSQLTEFTQELDHTANRTNCVINENGRETQLSPHQENNPCTYPDWTGAHYSLWLFGGPAYFAGRVAMIQTREPRIVSHAAPARSSSGSMQLRFRGGPKTVELWLHPRILQSNSRTIDTGACIYTLVHYFKHLCYQVSSSDSSSESNGVRSSSRDPSESSLASLEALITSTHLLPTSTKRSEGVSAGAWVLVDSVDAMVEDAEVMPNVGTPVDATASAGADAMVVDAAATADVAMAARVGAWVDAHVGAWVDTTAADMSVMANTGVRTVAEERPGSAETGGSGAGGWVDAGTRMGTDVGVIVGTMVGAIANTGTMTVAEEKPVSAAPENEGEGTCVDACVRRDVDVKVDVLDCWGVLGKGAVCENELQPFSGLDLDPHGSEPPEEPESQDPDPHFADRAMD